MYLLICGPLLESGIIDLKLPGVVYTAVAFTRSLTHVLRLPVHHLRHLFIDNVATGGGLGRDGAGVLIV
jgi:hypothetical protein